MYSIKSSSQSYLLIFLFLCLQIKTNGQNKNNIFDTNPSGAEILDKQKDVIGKTPFDLTNLPKKTDTVYIVKENFDTTYIIFPINVDYANFPNSILYCEPCRILPTQINYKVNPIGILQLRKIKKDDESDRYRTFTASILPFDFLITDTTVIGMVGEQKIKLTEKKTKALIGLADQITSPALSGFYDSYIRAIPFNEEHKEYALFRMKATFKNLFIDFSCKNNNHYKGIYSIDSEWAIFSKFDSINPIASYHIHSSLYRAQNKVSTVLRSLAYDTEKQLLEIDSLYDFLIAQEKLILSTSKGKEIIFNKPPHNSFNSLKEINRYASPNVVTVEGEKGFGSGFFIASEGYLITNYHVIDKEKKIKVRINKDTKLDAEIIKTNMDYDLALLKVDFDSLPGLWLANSDSIEVGDPVVAIGTPLDKRLSSTLTKGIISGTREIAGLKLIQTDVSINSGSSGGPLINEKGEVIGMSTMKLKGNGIEGISFCIPSNDIVKMLNIIYK